MNTLPSLPRETRMRARAIANEIAPVFQYLEQYEKAPGVQERTANALRPIVRKHLAFFNEIAADVADDAERCGVWLVSHYVPAEAAARQFVSMQGGAVYALRMAPEIVAGCMPMIDDPGAVIAAALEMERVFTWAVTRLGPELVPALAHAIRPVEQPSASN